MVHVTRMRARDRDAVHEIARLSDVKLDVERDLAHHWVRMWVARLGDEEAEPAGFLLAWFVAHELHLIHIATHPSARRQGVGKALMKELVWEAAGSRSQAILLELRRSNEVALRLYRSFGFWVCGVRERYYADTGEDAIEMMLRFDPRTGRPQPGRDEIAIGEA